MRIHKTSCIAIATAFIVATATAGIAFADGMPSKEKPAAIPTPLDAAVNEVQNKEPPVAIVEPAPVPAAEAQQIEQFEPQEAAAETPPPVPESRIVEVQENTSFLGLSIGAYDPMRSKNRSPSFNVEWQPGVKIAGFLQPIFGAWASTEGAMMGYGGMGTPFHIGDSIFVMPSLAVGAYKEGAGYDLGRTLAFRLGTELSYEMENKSRIGINAHVITNGETAHKEDRTGVISLVYTMPLNGFTSAE